MNHLRNSKRFRSMCQEQQDQIYISNYKSQLSHILLYILLQILFFASIFVRFTHVDACILSSFFFTAIQYFLI